MNNRELAERLKTFANLIEIKGENAFRVNAFRRAGDVVEDLDQPVTELVSEGTLTDVQGIGPGIAAALTEMVETGQFAAMDEVLDVVPSTLLTMLDIPGVGPKTVARFYRELGITDLMQLDAAAHRGDIRALKGFGARQEERITKGIAFLNKRTGRLSIGTALPAAESAAQAIAAALGCDAEVAGSTRRMCETVGNIDLVVATDDVETVAREAKAFASDAEATADNLVVGEHDCGVQIRIKVAPPEQFGTELLRWTGSRAFVEALTDDANGDLPVAETEESLFSKLGLDVIPPELREDPDVIRMARAHELPKLISVSDLRGDLHLHSDWSDGHGTILEMATEARALGYEYLSIADHSGGLAIARGLNADRLREQRIEIDRVNELVPEVRLLRASEVEVHPDGSLDFPDEVLADLDLVVASLHSALSRSTDELTDRIEKVIRNPHVDIIAHPTGRIIERRPGGTYHWERVFKAARETGTAIEINANPARLDMSDEVAREARIAGVTISIDTDAHDVNSLHLMRYGIGLARRAGIGPKDVINTRSLEQLLAWLSR